MLNSVAAAGGADDAIAQGDQPACRFPGLSPQNGSTTSIDARSLPPGIEVVVDTDNSRYRFVMRGGHGSKALVQGGRYFPGATTVRIAGSTCSGSLLKIGRIELGLFGNRIS
jgi:hypothetical protein